MKEESDITLTTLSITGIGKKQQVIRHYSWENWPERGLPDPSLTVFNLICAIRNLKKPIVVHCSNGRFYYFSYNNYFFEKKKKFIFSSHKKMYFIKLNIF